MVALQNLLDAAVEALDHAVGLRRLRRREAMLDVEGGAQFAELVLAGRGTLAQAEEAIRELLAVIRKNGTDAQRASAFQVTKEAAGIGCRRGLEDADQNPACRPVDCHEEIAPRGLVSH